MSYFAWLVSVFSYSNQEQSVRFTQIDNVLNGELLKRTRLSCQRINRDLITSLYGATPLLSHDGDRTRPCIGSRTVSVESPCELLRLIQGLPSLSTATDYPCVDNLNAQNLKIFQLAELHAISQTAQFDMFVALPLKRKTPRREVAIPRSELSSSG